MTIAPSRTDDSTFLERFAETRDEDAFRALVDKYTGVVYGVALRRTGKHEAAEEVAQIVFQALARKAGSIAGRRPVSAWLHRAATLESLKHLRNDANHQRHLAMIREHQEQEHRSQEDESVWKDVRPFLDELLNRLSTNEREILVEHYIEGVQFDEIASRVGVSAAAVQKRSVRALQKLARLLTKRSIALSATFLAAGLGAELGRAAPVGLATKIGTSALNTSTAVSTSTATTLISTVTIMSTSKFAFVAAFLIAASVPVGFRVAESRASTSLTLNSGDIFEREAGSAIRKTAVSSEFDVERFRRSVERLHTSEPVNDRQSRRLQRLMLTLNVSDIQKALAVLEEFEMANSLLDIVGAAYVRWAELEPESAVADAHARPKSLWGYYPINSVWVTWAFSDWDAARAWNASNQDTFGFWSYLDWQAERDGELAVKHAAQIAEDFPEDGDRYVRRAFQAWSESDPDKAIAWMDENLTDPVPRDDFIGSGLQQLAERDPRKALDNMKLLDNPERLREVRFNVFWEWAHLQPSEAATYFDEINGAATWNVNTVRSVAESIAGHDPVRALEIARKLEDSERSDSFYCGILCSATQSDLGLVREAADAISAQGARTNNSLGAFLDHWAATDRDAAAAWVEALPDGDKKAWARHIFPQE